MNMIAGNHLFAVRGAFLKQQRLRVQAGRPLNRLGENSKSIDFRH
jgi:hypothetical protein